MSPRMMMMKSRIQLPQRPILETSQLWNHSHALPFILLTAKISIHVLKFVVGQLPVQVVSSILQLSNKTALKSQTMFDIFIWLCIMSAKNLHPSRFQAGCFTNLTICLAQRLSFAVVDDSRRSQGSLAPGRADPKSTGAPTSFHCPISMELMADPVMIATGHTYDRQVLPLNLPITCISALGQAVVKLTQEP